MKNDLSDWLTIEEVEYFFYNHNLSTVVTDGKYVQVFDEWEENLND